jgi:hypothetical protein
VRRAAGTRINHPGLRAERIHWEAVQGSSLAAGSGERVTLACALDLT